jgi:hypothetical protein
MKRLRQWLRGKWFDWKNRNQPRGYCMCGSPVDKHSFGDGHSPVEDYAYHRVLYTSAEAPNAEEQP